ncbi:alpha/beta hydrolase [Acuticoccus sediminis]|uniref:alpha/beta hydrolase n=1 Tax=Acuticoccus sediminis TaxID=2184697 RepID=UPI00192E33AC|nr:alpha/beta hydrolase [Acuticoccus sediminis]
MPSLHELFGPDAISEETRQVNDALKAQIAAAPQPDSLDAARHAFATGASGIPVSPQSSRARSQTLSTAAGDIGVRVLVPEVVRGIYLHIHGGGWVLGANDMWDDMLESLVRNAGLACMSVAYRLAPEHPFPAARDDCVAAATWLVENAEREFGTSCLLIGGESAGAHLAALTLLRLRDAGLGKPFKAANLMYGCFDLGLTPSLRMAAETPVIDRAGTERFIAAFSGGADPDHPALSPLYADLRDLPPALFSVGTLDPLLDDSLFMHMRWQAAGNPSELAVYPGGVHGFNCLTGQLAEAANAKAEAFLKAFAP